LTFHPFKTYWEKQSKKTFSPFRVQRLLPDGIYNVDSTDQGWRNLPACPKATVQTHLYLALGMPNGEKSRLTVKVRTTEVS
jgi:hypothetical protein